MAAGELGAETLILHSLARIREFDVDGLNSVLRLNPRALEIARQRDRERARGEVRGPLHGVPVLIKDNIATRGLATSAGSHALRDWLPSRDATVVARLRDSGAVILGKTNLSEWANFMDPSMPNGFSVVGGQTHHPFGPFDPLGSSTGSAVAVATGLAPLAVGTETQGSIILPGSVNGVVALKPTHGLLDSAGIVPIIPWMDVPGPFARTVREVALLLGVMAGAPDRYLAAPGSSAAGRCRGGDRGGAALGAARYPGSVPGHAPCLPREPERLPRRIRRGRAGGESRGHHPVEQRRSGQPGALRSGPSAGCAEQCAG